MQFFESFSSYPNETDKQDEIQIFYCLIINSLSLAFRWQQQRDLSFAIPPAVYPRR